MKNFYYENEISWQAPGRKNRIIVRELTDTAKKVKKNWTNLITSDVQERNTSHIHSRKRS